MVRRRAMLLLIAMLGLFGFGCASPDPGAYNGERVFDPLAKSRDRAYTSDVEQDPVGFYEGVGYGIMQELYGTK